MGRSPSTRLLDWCRTAWQPAALAAAACLVVAGLWPGPSQPPAPAPEAPGAQVTAPVRPSAGKPEKTTSAPGDGTTPSPTSTVAPATPSPRLLVASLGISAPVREVGVVGQELEVPEDPGEVGIWRDGARPGDDAGTVLVTGHVSWDGRRGALWSLAAAGPGDIIDLLTPDGDASRWRVVSIDRLPRDADHRELFTTDGQHRLVVVTCGGPVVDGHYRDLVQVVAVRK